MASCATSSLELLTAARELGGPVTVLVIGADPAPLAGADAILHADAEHFEPHVHAAAVRQAIERVEPAWILAPHSVDAMGYAAAVAAELGLGFASDVHVPEPRHARRSPARDARVRRAPRC